MKGLFCTVFAFMVIIAAPAYANLEPLDPAVRDKQLAQAEQLYANQDVDALLKLLKESHLFIKQDVALNLGRLGVDKALPILRQYDQSYSRFACAESGQFGVAVILIENNTAAAQKKALLAVATEPQKKGEHSHSVIDAAGRELSRYEGDDIVKSLVDIRTYGAQYTVLKLQCRKLSESDTISKCVAVLEAHLTPQKAQASEQILIAFGMSAKLPVENLKERVEKRIKPTDPTFTMPKTIRNRCNRIIKQIEKDEKANKSDALKGLSDAQFEHALRNMSTAPNYVLITVINGNTGKREAVCIEAGALLSAINVERKLKGEEAVLFSLEKEDRVFRFSYAAALKLISRSYTETILTEAREFLANMTIDEIEAATSNQDSKFYEFCARNPGAFIARFPAIAHVLTGRGILCVRGCLPGLFHIDRRTHNQRMQPTAKQRGG